MPTMISPAKFVQESLNLHLFFLRIMKEHALFIQASLVPKDKELINRTDRFRKTFEALLKEAVQLADNNVSRFVLNSGEVVTDRTLQMEKKTQDLSGIPIDLALTRSETRLRPGPGNPALERRVQGFNERVIRETTLLAELKEEILEGMLNCTIFTTSFPELLAHVRHEALFFIHHLQWLQKRMAMEASDALIQEKLFWDHIMADHSEFIAHLLDPTERDLIMSANDFARRFNNLENRIRQVKQNNSSIPNQLLRDEIQATREIRDFKNTAGQLILDCEVRSIIIPLLADHVLREANHFLALLVNRRTEN